MLITLEMSGNMIAMKQVTETNIVVHIRFLKMVMKRIVLFLREGFLFEEHIEDLISEWVVADWECHEKHHDNCDL